MANNTLQGICLVLGDPGCTSESLCVCACSVPSMHVNVCACVETKLWNETNVDSEPHTQEGQNACQQPTGAGRHRTTKINELGTARP